jgi:hypothetical protein
MTKNNILEIADRVRSLNAFHNAMLDVGPISSKPMGESVQKFTAESIEFIKNCHPAEILMAMQVVSNPGKLKPDKK